MKKILVSLLVLAMAAPAMAVVTFDVQQVPGEEKAVITMDTGGDVVRGVALLVECTEGASLVDLSYDVNAEFNTFIDFLSVNSGTVFAGDTPDPINDSPTPHPYAAAGTTAGVAVAGPTTTTFVVSMGVLDELGAQDGYNGSGNLITINTGAGNVCVSLDTVRGGVVGDAALTSNLDAAATDCVTIVPIQTDCWTGDAASRTEWESVGSPEAWCVSNNPRQCLGDADGLPFGKNNYWVATGDLNVLLAAWNKTFAQIDGQTYNGVPLINADFDHLPFGKNNYRVATGDLNILLSSWNINNGPSDTICQDVLGDQRPLP